MSLDFTIQLTYRHRVCVTRDVFGTHDGILAKLLQEDLGERTARAIVVIDDGLIESHPRLPETITAWFADAPFAELAHQPLIIPGGETCKNDWRYLHQIWEAIHQGQLCRHSYLLAIGGGAVLDCAGFAAATAHRGIRHLRLPTTSLAQGDGGVGVKNAVNRFGLKNWIGTFQVPHAVINDADFLATLPPRQLRGGLVEALKVALIRDADFYARLSEQRRPLAHLQLKPVEAALQRSAELHVQHIATSGDPFESGSARPLDFGHWAAHKLEQLSDFAISHGDAVAIGVALDILYSARIGMLPHDSASDILQLMSDLRFPLYHPLLQETDEDDLPVIFAGLEEFREHLGGELTITLLDAIGSGREVNTIDREEMLAAIDELSNRPDNPASQS